MRSPSWIAATALLFITVSCDSGEPAVSSPDPSMFSSDAALYTFLTQEDPFPQYTLFPHADSVVAGSLNGSTAHSPLVRVSLNATAAASLPNGRFPAGGSFRDSSVVFKEIKDPSGVTTLLAVAVKQRSNPLAAQGWLWAEYGPDGSVVYPVGNKGAGCIGCHSLEQGQQHDFIRTFERQTP